jgi:hypothetical protein
MLGTELSAATGPICKGCPRFLTYSWGALKAVLIGKIIEVKSTSEEIVILGQITVLREEKT